MVRFEFEKRKTAWRRSIVNWKWPAGLWEHLGDRRICTTK